MEENKVKVAVVDDSDIFVDENRTFEVIVRYYKDGKNLMVETIDEGFDNKKEGINEFKVAFRYPSFSDYLKINPFSRFNESGQVGVGEMFRLQHDRIEILIKSWSLSRPIAQLKDINIKFIKAIMNKVTEEIGFDGII